MRRNLYTKNIEVFITALKNLGWKEIRLKYRSPDREFRKGAFHLTLKRRSIGPYCIIHKDRFIAGRIHKRSVSKGDEIEAVYSDIVREYKRLKKLDACMPIEGLNCVGATMPLLQVLIRRRRS